ncbi:MAG TPA: membrane protein insertion efficiency factor YidD [Candidatus Enterenecus merdae]|nr:membrane protein insertion efficiency factor YidD [Candidatus Enterenecus merdae]
MKRLLLGLIRLYREKISPGRPPCCRFIPTCSTYALEAVEVHGALKGGLLSAWRVLRCHPFHRERSFLYDPVPPKGRWRVRVSK